MRRAQTTKGEQTDTRDLLLKRFGIEDSILLVDNFDRNRCAARFVTALFHHSEGAPVHGTRQRQLNPPDLVIRHHTLLLSPVACLPQTSLLAGPLTNHGKSVKDAEPPS